MTEDELRTFLDAKLYEIGSALMEYYDCCGIRGATCKAFKDQNLCCYNGMFGKGLCPHWQDNECKNPNCDCKLWICKTARVTTEQKCVDGLVLLEQFGKLFGIVREPLIGRNYSGADRQPK